MTGKEYAEEENVLSAESVLQLMKLLRIFLYVVKRDKSREVFDRNKLTAGILRACEKRPVSVEQVEEMVTDIELTAQNGFEREITAEQIGELVMERLKKVDEVSYVRFASVYRQFKDINTFMEELNKLLTEKK